MTIESEFEENVLGKVVTALLEHCYRVEISDQDGGGLYVYAYPDNGKPDDDGARHWVSLTPGNGVDFVRDYSTNLESVLKPINDFIKTYL